MNLKDRMHYPGLSSWAQISYRELSPAGGRKDDAERG